MTAEVFDDLLRELANLLALPAQPPEEPVLSRFLVGDDLAVSFALDSETGSVEVAAGLRENLDFLQDTAILRRALEINAHPGVLGSGAITLDGEGSSLILQRTLPAATPTVIDLHTTLAQISEDAFRIRELLES